jgi:flagellar motor switch protein FliN/FliY
MSESAQELTAPVRSLLDEWRAGLARVLESMTDQKAEVQWSSGIAPAPDAETLWWEQPFQISAEALVWIAAPRLTWEHAGTVTLKAAGLDTVEIGEARNTWFEILGQSLGGMAGSIGAVVGREVTCAPGREHAPAETPEIGAAVSIHFPDIALPPLWIGFTPTLVSMLSSPPPSMPARGGEEKITSLEPEPEFANPGLAVPPTMDLILDVELAVSISFGKTELPMNDVLKLTTGSIVELNRAVNDPVEVMVNNCLIARGEVVVVEGNYGVRIQHIVSKLDRMRSMQ